MPWLSLRPCVASPAAAARQRTVAFVSGPNGNKLRLSCACRKRSNAVRWRTSCNMLLNVTGDVTAAQDTEDKFRLDHGDDAALKS